MKQKKTLSFCLFILFAISTNAQVKLDIDASKTGITISPMEYGIFFEDINHAADGGLYAELIRNRSFEDQRTVPEGWSLSTSDNNRGELSLISKGLLNSAQKQALKISIPKGTSQANPISLFNEGFWGINVVKGRTYKLTFWAKTDGNYKGELIAGLAYDGGEICKKVEGTITKKWQKFSVEITADANDAKGRFVLKFNSPGTVCLDVVSLMPPTFKNHPNGCRPELAQLLYDLHPKFMRFPGGCFVEGLGNEENMFKWKRTVGPIETRPGHMNSNWGYRTSDGMGFHEFLQLAEDIGAKPLFVVNVGIWHGGYRDIKDLKTTYLQDALDAIEYANGDVTTKYGAMRAANGHPAPFNLEYVEIGNENYNFHINDNSDQSYQYPERYKMFYDAIKAKYPHINLIANVAAWGTDSPKWNNNYPVDIVDEHYYRSPVWFENNFNKYDNYDRSKYKVYTGEYAVTQGFGKVGNLSAALGEATFMMGMENNSDVVIMCSYAPIFVNENNIAWQPDMIRYNSSQVMCTPSYYAQKLMANNVGTKLLKVEQSMPLDNPNLQNKKPVSVQVGVATWATASSYDDLQVTNADGTTLLKENCNDAKGWTEIQDKWQVKDGVISQLSPRNEGSMAVCNTQFTSSKYTVTARVRKDSGNEGCLVVFNFKDSQNFCWLNLGGWGNSQHAIEYCLDGAKTTLDACPGKVETGRWYDVKIEVDGSEIKCYLDNQLILKGKIPTSQKRIFQQC
jgi:alpha-L-arabinofuranosidase